MSPRAELLRHRARLARERARKATLCAQRCQTRTAAETLWMAARRHDADAQRWDALAEQEEL